MIQGREHSLKNFHFGNLNPVLIFFAFQIIEQQRHNLLQQSIKQTQMCKIKCLPCALYSLYINSTKVMSLHDILITTSIDSITHKAGLSQ